MAFPFYPQHDAMDCGPACLRMIARHYGRELRLQQLRENSDISRAGVSLLGISTAAEKTGLRTMGVRIGLEQLLGEANLPCILHWRENHFVVIPPQRRRTGRSSRILVADPADGLVSMDRGSFRDAWLGERREGLALLIEPTPEFYTAGSGEQDLHTSPWSVILFHLRQHRRYFFQVFLGLIAGSLLQLLFPFLTQSLVDTGIQDRNLRFIYILLAAQGMLFVARTAIEAIRSRLLLYISTRVNIALLTGFWHKLMRLPVSWFDTRLTGDIQQRLQDQHRIESFLTTGGLSVLFSATSILVFSIVLLLYSLQVFTVFLAGTSLYLLWVRLFFRRRRDLNYRRFVAGTQEHNTTLQLIQGMQEIRLANATTFFRWQWEQVQAKLFRLQFRTLSLTQAQKAGGFFINEGKNILITFLVARLVLQGDLTLGAMLAIQYIIGQLNSPVEQMVSFSQSYQDARIALERLAEIEAIPDEEPADTPYATPAASGTGLHLRNVSFHYPGGAGVPAVEGIDLLIRGKGVTAIVGASGSGKTTLLKLLLRFYENYSGDIRIGAGIPDDVQHATPDGSVSLRSVRPSAWRARCGVVMQDGYIFSDTLARNIAVGEEDPDPDKLQYACRVANLADFVEHLPLGLQTKVGAEGNGISQGQKQRILIARAVYKDPDYLFFDEATNALDANTERMVMDNLRHFFRGRTVVIVAHRLSTVRDADQIVVLDKGRIAEQGPHAALTAGRGPYYQLIKNQLELGT